jgi:hypothetical protein
VPFVHPVILRAAKRHRRICRKKRSQVPSPRCVQPGASGFSPFRQGTTNCRLGPPRRVQLCEVVRNSGRKSSNCRLVLGTSCVCPGHRLRGELESTIRRGEGCPAGIDRQLDDQRRATTDNWAIPIAELSKVVKSSGVPYPTTHARSAGRTPKAATRKTLGPGHFSPRNSGVTGFALTRGDRVHPNPGVTGSP